MAEEKLKKLLDQFERNREWADLVNWLNKVNEVLKHPSLKKIPYEEILAKRLYTYALIFQLHCGVSEGEESKRSKPWGNSLAFYSPGLFSFYQFAKLDVKLKFNDLIKRYYLRLGPEILSCLNGLVSILLLGLDDQNEEALKGIEEILQALERKIGTRMLYGTIWLAILRTSKIRYPALRYIIKSIPCTTEDFPVKRLYVNQDPYKVSNVEADHEELRVVNVNSDKSISEEELLYNFYPQKSSLVVNALIQCLQDELVFTQRCAFDFLSSHMPLKSDILSQNEKVCIIEAGCHLLLKKNDSIIRRLYSWVLGHIKEKEGSDEFISVKNDVALKVFVKAMQNLFHSNLKPATAPLQIVKTIFEDNEGFTERLLPEIASTMVRYLETYKAGYDFSEALTNFAKTFLNSERQLVLIWQALGSELSELMGEQNYKKVLQTINLIKFFLTAYDTSNEKFASKSKYLKPIFARILMSMGSLSNNLTIMENTIPGLKLIKEILLILEKEAQLESFGLMAEGIKKFVAFYAQFITFIMEGKYEKDEESWKFVEEAFSLATKNVVAIQVYIDPEREGTEWLTQLVQCIEEPAMPCEITVICIEGIISIYEEQKKGAMSYRYLQSCIQKESEIIAKLWDMIGQSPNDRKVVELIKRADNIMPVVLSSCVINKLLDEQITTKVSAINRFALFWKLAAEYFPTFIPFVTEPLCLFHMIDFLNHDHPLVRHSSKSWLAESTRRLERILDPIISRLLKNTFEESCNKDTGQLIYTSPYDTRIAIDAFKRLRSILLTNKTELMYFMMHNTASSELLELYSKEKARLLCDLVRDKSTYLQLLLFLSIKYIRGQAAEHLKSQFITENAAVNACGCEFLELLLTSVEPVDRAPEVANWVIKPLLHGLQNAFLSKDSVMQVEILKIVKLIQFKCVAQNKKYAENCLTIFLDPLYMGIVQNGLESEVSYVRSSYISYTKATLPLYTVFMGDKLELFITQIMKYLSSNLSKCTAMAGAKTAEEKLIANENDILQILGGVRSVIHHYFFEADLELDKESRVTLQKQVGLPSGKKAKACVELTRNRILATIGELFINAQKIWRQPRPFVIKNFKLSHTGILPFTNQSYSDTLNMYYKEKFSFELIAREFTSYQEGIIAIVLPIIEKHPDPVIKSILNVWLREHHRMNDEALRKIVRLS